MVLDLPAPGGAQVGHINILCVQPRPGGRCVWVLAHSVDGIRGRGISDDKGMIQSNVGQLFRRETEEGDQPSLGRVTGGKEHS